MMFATRLASSMPHGLFSYLSKPRRDPSPTEVLLDRVGAVAVMRTPARLVAESCVKGEAEPARVTGLRRLFRYLRGANCGASVVGMAAPLVQEWDQQGRWRLNVTLRPGTQAAVPNPLDPKVHVRAIPAETIAVLHTRGTMSLETLARARATLLENLAESRWVAEGAPMFRLHALPGALAWLRGRDVAVRVRPATEYA